MDHCFRLHAANSQVHVFTISRYGYTEEIWWNSVGHVMHFAREFCQKFHSSNHLRLLLEFFWGIRPNLWLAQKNKVQSPAEVKLSQKFNHFVYWQIVTVVSLKFLTVSWWYNVYYLLIYLQVVADVVRRRHVQENQKHGQFVISCWWLTTCIFVAWVTTVYNEQPATWLVSVSVCGSYR